MPELANADVYTGYWINWSKGRILGATITTTARVSTVVVALLAILVAVACTHLWNILVFCFHQSRANRGKADGLFRQQQVLLRTVPVPMVTIVDLIKLAHVWRRKASNVYLRCLILCFVALAFKLLATAAGLAVAYTVTTGDTVVLVDKTGRCHPIVSYYSDDVAPQMANNDTFYESRLLATIIDSMAYATQCYEAGQAPSSCRTFVKPRIKSTKSLSSCPFDPSICILQGDNAAITFDSGLLDSNDDFGINAPPGDRIQYRRTVSCAPIKVEPYMTTQNLSDFVEFYGRAALPNEPVILYHYGQLADLNWTSLYGPWRALYEHQYSGLGQNVNNYPRDAQGFHWIPELQLTDADLSLSQIDRCGVIAIAPIEDPVFSAHKEVWTDCPNCGPRTSNLVNGSILQYGCDGPTGVIACATQYQYCASGTCGKLTGYIPTLPRNNFPDANSAQLATMDLFTNVTDYCTIDMALNTVKPFLKVNDLVKNLVVAGPVPNNQWQIEVEAWDGFLWAATQHFVAKHAIGIPDGPTNIAFPTVSATEEKLCENQKMIKPGGFANINLFGLILVIIMSCILVVLDMILVRLLVFIDKFRRKVLGPRLEQWIQDGVLQLQRRAYQALGEGGDWTQIDQEIPIPTKGAELSGLSAPYGPSEKVAASSTSSVLPPTDYESKPKFTMASSTTQTESGASSNTSSLELSKEPQPAPNRTFYSSVVSQV